MHFVDKKNTFVALFIYSTRIRLHKAAKPTNMKPSDRFSHIAMCSEEVNADFEYPQLTSLTRVVSGENPELHHAVIWISTAYFIRKVLVNAIFLSSKSSFPCTKRIDK